MVNMAILLYRVISSLPEILLHLYYIFISHLTMPRVDNREALEQEFDLTL